MKEIEEVGAALETDLVKDDLKDIIAEMSNYTLEKIGSEIPIVSYFVKGMKLYNSFRDMQLMEKVNAFLFNWQKLNADERKKFTDKMKQDPVFGQKAGAFILSALDRYDFSIKAKYLSLICKYYGAGKYSKEVFVMLNKSVEALSVFNIERFLATETFNIINIYSVDDQFGEFLNAGLLMYDIRIRFDNSKHRATGLDGFHERAELSSKRTNLARLFFNVLNDNENKIAEV